MNAISTKTLNWSADEKAYVEQLYFDKWSPSGIAAQVHEKFGTDRTRQQVSDLIRISSVMNHSVTMDPRERRFIPRRKPVEVHTLPAPMPIVVAAVQHPHISEHSAQRIAELWRDGGSVHAIAAALWLPESAVSHFIRKHPEQCPKPVEGSISPKALTELAECQCRFPVSGHGDALLFCSADVDRDNWKPGRVAGSYCAVHSKRAVSVRK